LSALAGRLRRSKSRLAVVIAVASILLLGARAPRALPLLAAQVDDSSSGTGSTNWAEHIRSGKPFNVVLDRVPRGCDQLGTLQPGATYSVDWRRGTFYCTGFNRGANRVGQWAYSNADPSKSQISLWGRVVNFDGDGNVLDAACGQIGHLALEIPKASSRPVPAARATVRSPDTQIDRAMDEVRKGRFFLGDAEPFATRLATAPAALVGVLAPYVDDANERVRLQALDIIRCAGRRTADRELRRRVVQALSAGCVDEDSSTAFRAAEYLCQFAREDFDAASKAAVAAPIRRGWCALSGVLRLAGYLGLTETIPDIRRILASPRTRSEDEWSGYLALSRMGDDAATRYCIEQVGLGRRSFSDLVYTRQRAAFEHLIVVLNSDRPACVSPNPNAEDLVLCGYRVMEHFAPVIKDFPLRTIAGIRQIDTRDYPAALQTARQWFKDKAGHYEILDDSF
jgi:hypothetical protein